ncbi:hypothetical protein [Rhodococcus sp. JT-3]|uniref:hypothetical protein n=1 Tax=Rhodococcus sp. JT-3 TaxID=1973213 RepID=UPI0013034009|nr:hypothetical protein [Rhodococcus sp. JT-3]
MTDRIPYEEMRRLCGLPDVRWQVMGDRWRLAGQQINRAWREVLEPRLSDRRQSDFALAGRKP